MLHPIQLAIRNDQEGAQPSPCGIVLSEIKIHKFFWLFIGARLSNAMKS